MSEFGGKLQEETEDGIRDRSPSRGLGDVYKRQRRYDMRVKPEEFKVGEKVLYFSPRKYQGYQDKWLRKFTGPFEIIKLLGPANVVLRKSAKSSLSLRI